MRRSVVGEDGVVVVILGGRGGAVWVFSNQASDMVVGLWLWLDEDVFLLRSSWDYYIVVVFACDVWWTFLTE